MSRAWLTSFNPYAIGVDIFVVDPGQGICGPGQRARFESPPRARRWRCG